MHLIGNAAFWRDKDGTIDAEDVDQAMIDAADEVLRHHINPQVHRALQSSRDYRSILNKIVRRAAGVPSIFMNPKVTLSFWRQSNHGFAA